MRAATTQGFGPNAKLVVKELSKPKPAPDEVLVEVYASSVNPKDWKLNKNASSYIPLFGGLIKPMIMGDDIAGVIVDTGNRVSGFSVGDSIYGMSMGLRTGACAEYAVIAQNCIAKKPAHLSYGEAAAIPLAALTAFQAFKIGKLKADQKLLIIGASGGVGTFAVQIAKSMGAHVTGVCSGKNVEIVNSLGADAVIDYTVRDYINEENNLDMIFDVTSHQSLSECSWIMKDDGVYVSTVGGAPAYLNLIKDKFSLSKQISKPVFVDANARDLESLSQYLELGELKPVLDSEYSLDKIDEAYARSMSGRAVGKIVINVKN